MGSDSSIDPFASDDEKPQHTLNLPEFYIGKYEVTNAQYAACVKAGTVQAPDHWENGAMSFRQRRSSGGQRLVE